MRYSELTVRGGVPMFDYIWVDSDMCVFGRLHHVEYYSESSGTFLGRLCKITDIIGLVRVWEKKAALVYGVKFADSLDVPILFEYILPV